MNRNWKRKQSAKRRLAAKRAILIKEALRASVNTNDVVQDIMHSHLGTNVTTQQMRDWAQVHIHPKSNEFMRAFATLYAESYTLGQDIALNAIASVSIKKAPTKAQLKRAMGINWSTWKPGNRAAANLVKPSGGLRSLLDARDITIQGINRTSLDRIGTAIANVLQKGETPQGAVPTIMEEIAGYRQQLADELGIAIDDIMEDSERALMIAQTEMSRAVSVASRELYTESGVELVEWLVADPCDLCQENEDASPIGIGDTFPSGDTEPPAHPNCVCDIAPYSVDTRGIGEDALSMLLGEE